MGQDKASLLVEGAPLARRIADALLSLDIPVTVLGRTALEGCEFVADEEEYAGPLRALARFEPHHAHVLVASCDLPRFDPRIVALLQDRVGAHEAAIPKVHGSIQPLCALYAHSAFEVAKQKGSQASPRVMDWLESLDLIAITEDDMESAGLNPACVSSANTPEELDSLMDCS